MGASPGRGEVSAGTELPARRGEGEWVPPSTATFSSPVRSGFDSPLAFPRSLISENNIFKKTPHNHKKLLPGVCTKQTSAPGLRTGPRVLISLQQQRGTGQRRGGCSDTGGGCPDTPRDVQRQGGCSETPRGCSDTSPARGSSAGTSRHHLF